MGELVYQVHVSLDGCAEGPRGEFDWAPMGPELSAHSEALTGRSAVLAYGRRVWEMMAGYWPTEEALDDPHGRAFAPIWLRMPKVVFSRTLTGADWNTRVLSGDLAEEVATLKAAHGKDILLNGGAALPAELSRLGLIDEYQVFVHPLVLGGDKRPFAVGTERFGLELVESRVFDGRAVLLRYRRSAG
ncbi:dihydrofolate reductase family protein [Amycolatopsis sp. PS_44_ISF1]|uniref:dihydrofolate reductase family protein n=1 Tax=Amycolatopsis sp. PS_44_ISF1 TaxID=2974917 RepID=UPI0028DDB79F|nr:dihydrofolate reductase family protein [Amycolatopsis sp. PS_44_ISF1]MDT8914193.1 dihydrofolate reductase family protein [Amycolatopsis sp. PS_44_ISF1]